MIFAGALLLNLPAASENGKSVGFVNALFTAASANCVTGLVVVNTREHWSWFGKLVILLLIQLGALGFLTILTLGFLLLGPNQKISLKTRLLIQSSFNQESVGGMVRLVKSVFWVTAAAEASGAVLLACAFRLASSMTFFEACRQGLFHSISAFCNAGFDNIGPNSLTPYQENFLVNFAVMALIIAGGLGFSVWAELLPMMRNREKRSLRFRVNHLSLHGKMAIGVTAALILSGTALFTLFEWENSRTLGGLPPLQKARAALFQSITLRTAGFNTIDQGGLTDISKFFACLLMLIGGSPASAAGGMKTVTVGVIVVSMISALRGRNGVEAFGRSLSLDLLQKALAVACAMLAVTISAAIVLHFTEREALRRFSFIDLMFEICSAVGTVGVTTGLTPFLSEPGKLVVTFVMFLGRVSPMTIAVALNMKLETATDNTKYPEERVIIG
jgi:trk system potassium uptake protein TrkH